MRAQRPLLPLVLALVGLCALAVFDCRRKSTQLPDGPGPGTYTVRGEIVQLPGDAMRELVVRHEAIPDFVDQSGTKVGMDAMVMPFSLASDVHTRGLAIGDKIRFVLVVDWSQLNYRITAIEKLPAKTALRFGPSDAR